MKHTHKVEGDESDGENAAVQVVLSDAQEHGLDELHERAARILSQDLDLCDVPGEHVDQNLSLPPPGALRLEASMLWPSPETSQHINN